MDSLLANYADSDEEEVQEEQKSRRKQEERSSNPMGKENDNLAKPNGGFSSLPPPKSSLFNSLPPPRETSSDLGAASLPKFKREEVESTSDDEEEEKDISKPKTSSSSLFASLPQRKSSLPSGSLFSSLPPPKAHVTEVPEVLPEARVPASASSGGNSKRVVQFRPPIMSNTFSSNENDEDEDEDEDEEEEEKKRKRLKESESGVQTSSVKSFLSSIPAPKNSATLGSLPSGSGTGRRSILETNVSNVPASDTSGGVGNAVEDEVGVNPSMDYYEDQSGDGSSVSYDYSSWSHGNVNYGNGGNDGGYGYDSSGGGAAAGDYTNWGGANGDYTNYSADYGDYANYGQYESNLAHGTTTSDAPEVSGLAESALRVPGKRGKNPVEIVEVKQDELIKNRPREDQVKLTGIAFGPAYQPASTKGKPSKLHKRKHQIGSLYFEMRQKETELAERRARGFLTKAQTQGKYGW